MHAGPRKLTNGARRGQPDATQHGKTTLCAGQIQLMAARAIGQSWGAAASDVPLLSFTAAHHSNGGCPAQIVQKLTFEQGS